MTTNNKKINKIDEIVVLFCVKKFKQQLKNKRGREYIQGKMASII